MDLHILELLYLSVLFLQLLLELQLPVVVPSCVLSLPGLLSVISTPWFNLSAHLLFRLLCWLVSYYGGEVDHLHGVILSLHIILRLVHIAPESFVSPSISEF